MTSKIRIESRGNWFPAPSIYTIMGILAVLSYPELFKIRFAMLRLDSSKFRNFACLHSYASVDIRLCVFSSLRISKRMFTIIALTCLTRIYHRDGHTKIRQKVHTV